MMSGLLKNIFTKSNANNNNPLIHHLHLHPKPNPLSSFPHNHFCTTSTHTQQQPQHQPTTEDPFLQSLNPNADFVYGKMSQIGKYTTKNDVIHLLEAFDLSPHDIKVGYNRIFNPEGMVLQFPNRFAFDNAVKAIGRKGRLYRLETADRRLWDTTEHYDGKTVLLQGLPRNAQLDDVERFLCGCNFNSSNLQMFLRQSFPESVRMALVQFPSEIEAMNAVIAKNRSFCLNNQILMRVLQ